MPKLKLQEHLDMMHTYILFLCMKFPKVIKKGNPISERILTYSMWGHSQTTLTGFGEF